MIRRVSTVVGSVVFLVIAPGFVAGLVPWWISNGRSQTRFPAAPGFRFVGGILIALAVISLLDSFVRFAVEGAGTPAPIFPTRQLVVSGLYRFVRNPMYLAVVSAILGQGLLLGNVTLLAYGALVWLLLHVFVLAYEEPALRESFGSEYQVFCSSVPGGFPVSPLGRSRPQRAKRRPRLVQNKKQTNISAAFVARTLRRRR
jgi:protein-S-isoprenylcysteine O-methyltransferase Ste14